VVDVLNGKVELILVPVMSTAILGAAIGEHPVDPDFVLIEEGDHPIVEDVGSCERRLAGVQPGEANL